MILVAFLLVAVGVFAFIVGLIVGPFNGASMVGVLCILAALYLVVASTPTRKDHHS